MGNTTRDSSRPGSVHRIRHHVEAVAEQVPVEIERHGRRLVAEHLLDDPYVCAGGDGQRGRQLIDEEAVDRDVPPLVSLGRPPRPVGLTVLRCSELRVRSLLVCRASEDAAHSG